MPTVTDFCLKDLTTNFLSGIMLDIMIVIHTTLANESFNGKFFWTVTEKFSHRAYSCVEEKTITYVEPMNLDNVNAVYKVSASGDELNYIRDHIKGIPFSYATIENHHNVLDKIEHWYGDHAKFIAAFLPR